MFDLGTLGGNTSYGYGINTSGNVVGASLISGSFETFHGFIVSGRKMYDLNALLDNASRHYVIVNASGINTAGQIAADAMINGATHAVLLTPNAAR